MLKYLVVIISFLSLNIVLSQNEIVTDKILVKGNCVMCKKRIESSLVIKGVTKVNWDIDSKFLTISYLPSKTNLDIIKKRIAKTGHDTKEHKTSDRTYSKLHNCCKYERE